MVIFNSRPIIDLQEALDVFNDWFQHFHHSVPVSRTNTVIVSSLSILVTYRLCSTGVVIVNALVL